MARAQPTGSALTPGSAAADTVDILRSDAVGFDEADWDNPDARSIAFVFSHRGTDSFALLLNAAENAVEFTVPGAPHTEWELALSSDDEQRVQDPVTTLMVKEGSFTLLRSRASA